MSLSRLARSLVVVLALMVVRCGGNPGDPDGGPEDGTPADGRPGDGGGDGTGPDGVSDQGGTDRKPDLKPEEPYCGDGVVNQPGEQCDDGNSEGGDGCSETCKIEANYQCPPAGGPCTSTVRCGDGVVNGNEQCDDGNDEAGDGCSETCQQEEGWICQSPGRPCRAAECGDGIVAGLEECDLGDATPTDGCVNCQLVPGFACPTPGQPCTVTSCGDGVPEGTEQCDDGNSDLGDGCSPFCQREPDCSQGACVSACGDGILLGDEECDDGNTRDGDGCSSDCKVELGFYCTQPPLAEQLVIPLVIRDFAGTDPVPAVNAGPPADYAQPNHVDFEVVSGELSGLEDGVGTAARLVRAGTGAGGTGRGRDLGRAGETFDIRHLDGSTIATVSLAGKPVFAQDRAACDRTALPSTANSFSKCTRTVMDADSFHSWYIDRDSQGDVISWPNFLGRGQTRVTTITLLNGTFPNASPDNTFTPGGAAYVFDSRFMRLDGSRPTPPDIENGLGFFPIDDLGTTGLGEDGLQHNFHFTSEVRFWFQYDAADQAQLSFSGDDDVWVYVNGHLALDIGGIHGREARSFTIDAANATSWGLSDGQVYEIAVFQAERNVVASNYLLTLRGFNTARSECSSQCGDGLLASDEVCDDGDDNYTGPEPIPYGRCGADCQSRGPFCGDGDVQSSEEECDNGSNISVYDFDGTGCAPGCVRPPFCGDAKIQAPFESCDDGKNDNSYNGCTPDCQLGPRCGDRTMQADQGEECDDGPQGSVTCTPNCKRRRPQG